MTARRTRSSTAVPPRAWASARPAPATSAAPSSRPPPAATSAWPRLAVGRRLARPAPQPAVPGRGVVIVLFIVMAIFPQLFARADPQQAASWPTRARRPSGEHLFGYDLQGCDYYARVGLRRPGVDGRSASLVVARRPASSARPRACAPATTAAWSTPCCPAHHRHLLGDAVPSWARSCCSTLFADRAACSGSSRWSWCCSAGRRCLRLRPLVGDQRQGAGLRGRPGRWARPTAASCGRHILPNALAPVIVYGTIARRRHHRRRGDAVVPRRRAAAAGHLLGAEDQRRARARCCEAPHLLLFPGLFLALTVLAFIMHGRRAARRPRPEAAR